MKQIDRFLLAIIAGIALLVVVALTLALTGGRQEYLAETTPSAVAHNYLLALKQRDDQRAYSYLAPDLSGYPPDIDAFSADIQQYNWQFNRDSATISVGNEQISGDRAVVDVSETYFSSGGLFSSGQYTTSFTLTLRREGDAWRLVGGDSYWASCWTTSRPCE